VIADPRKAAPTQEESDGTQPSEGVLLVERLDWSDESGVERLFESLAKAGLPSRPGLVLGADLSYDRDTIVLLVATISRLRSECGGPGRASQVAMLLVHDKRSPATTKFLLEQLATARLEHKLASRRARAKERVRKSREHVADGLRGHLRRGRTGGEDGGENEANLVGEDERRGHRVDDRARNIAPSKSISYEEVPE